MARILLAWELGGGYGHLLPLVEIGRELAAAGHECAYVLRDPARSHALLDSATTRIYQAPLFQPEWRNDAAVAHTFADLLANIGYRQAGPLTALIAAWRQIYADFCPDLVIFDHAPTAQAAARELDIARIIIARTGFAIPPPTSPLPNLRAFQGAVEPAALERAEHAVLGVLNEAFDRLGMGRIEFVAQLFEADSRILFSLPELDPYGPRDEVRYWGPLAQSGAATVNWPAAKGEGKKVFAYLKPFPTLDALMEIIATSAAAALVHVSGMSAAECRRRSGGNMQFTTELLDTSRVMPECDVVVSHAGSLAPQAVLAGKPLLTLPLQLEQQLTALRLEAMGVALNAPRRAPVGMQNKLHKLLHERGFTDTAQAFATRYPHYPAPLDGRFAALLEKLL